MPDSPVAAVLAEHARAPGRRRPLPATLATLVGGVVAVFVLSVCASVAATVVVLIAPVRYRRRS